MNIIAQVEFELAYNIIVQHVSNYTLWTPFPKIVKVTNHTGQWNAKLTWYSPSATHWICLYGVEHNLLIQDFRLT